MPGEGRAIGAWDIEGLAPPAPTWPIDGRPPPPPRPTDGRATAWVAKAMHAAAVRPQAKTFDHTVNRRTRIWGISANPPPVKAGSSG